MTDKIDIADFREFIQNCLISGYLRQMDPMIGVVLRDALVHTGCTKEDADNLITEIARELAEGPPPVAAVVH